VNVLSPLPFKVVSFRGGQALMQVPYLNLHNGTDANTQSVWEFKTRLLFPPSIIIYCIFIYNLGLGEVATLT
jgi:hypothetical protein